MTVETMEADLPKHQDSSSGWGSAGSLYVLDIRKVPCKALFEMHIATHLQPCSTVNKLNMHVSWVLLSDT